MNTLSASTGSHGNVGDAARTDIAASLFEPSVICCQNASARHRQDGLRSDANAIDIADRLPLKRDSK
jgi:hypothetical protein